MPNFTSKHDIEQIKIPPDQPFANNVEATVMKLLLNNIKIGYIQNQNEIETFSSFLTNYWDNPHISIDVACCSSSCYLEMGADPICP